MNPLSIITSYKEIPIRTSLFTAYGIAMVAWATAATALGQVSQDDGVVAGLREKLRTTEFEFSRSDSEVPFLPVASLSAAAYGKTEFQRVDGSGDKVEFRSSYVGGYAIAPLHVGRRDLVCAVPYASRTRFTSLTDGLPDASVDSLYLPVGGAWQAADGKQWGGFVMPSVHSPLAGDGDWAADFMGGALGRCFSGDRAVWYYGLIYDYAFGGNSFYPYLGYSYQFDPHWLFSLIAPWPAIAYAPSDRFFMKAGVMPSGATWALDQTGKDAQVTGAFGGWDLGVHCNWRLNKLLWLSVGTGFSGLRSLQVNDTGDVGYEQDLSREPFVNVSLSARPNLGS